jgi:superfamily I DNA and/or RNA helicase
MNSIYIKEMLLALGANIEYLRQEGSSQLRVKNGRLLNSIGDVYIYEFVLEFFQTIELDTDIEVRVRNESATGRIIAVDEKNIHVELDKNLGVTIPEARLIISSYYLLQLLHEKLKKVDSGEIQLTDLAEKTFKLKSADISSIEDYHIPFSITDLPNPSQEKAIKLALGSEVSFVWGPPGTGKTKTIARITEGFLAKNLSVLLLSHTNVATDGALLDVVEHLQDTDDYREGKFLREGTIQKSELKSYEMVIPTVVLERKGLPVKNEIGLLTEKIDGISLVASKSEIMLRKFQKVALLRKEESNIEGDIARKEIAVSTAKSAIVGIENQLQVIEEKITKCQSMGTIRRFFSGLNIEKLTHEKMLILVQKDKEKQKIIACGGAVDHAKNKLKAVYSERKNIEEQLRDENINNHKIIVEKAQTEVRNLKEQRDLLQKQLDELANNLIKEAKVIATTLTKSYSSPVVLNREYDCVVVDEASMAPLPALWCAAGLAKQKVVIVGDFFQLPPIAKHKVLKRKEKTEEEIKREEALVEKWLKSDIFEISGIVKAIQTGVRPNWLEQLNIQYRMHPDIADVVNFLVYEKCGPQFRLNPDGSTFAKGKSRIGTFPLKNSHVGIYDTGGIGSLPCRTDSGSYYNLYQAFLSVFLAKQAIENGYESVGIISPFRAQTNLIQKIVKDEHLEHIRADTVHRFQGGEEQIIIFDTTTPQPTKLTDDQKEGGDDEKLLNVAFSRAEEKCVVIADILAIEKKHSTTSLLRKFVQYCHSKDNSIISSTEMLPKYSVSEKTERWLKQINNISEIEEEFEKSQLFDQTDFYQNFTKDLLSAKHEVIIDSPYITAERSRYFAPIFEHLLSKSVKIFVLTRQPKEHGSGMKYQAEGEIRNFEKMGIVVLSFVGYVHRKLAIIDRRILWEGSLNILSQKDSHEIMRRFVGEETAQQMMTFLKLDKNIGKIGENKLQRCEYCVELGAWYWTDKSVYGGYWTFCLIGGHKLGTKPKSKEEIKKIKEQVKVLRKAKKKTTSEGIPICPKHDLPMIKREGPYGQFWGCQRYPACKITHKMNN